MKRQYFLRQPGLFARARRTDPETSHEAAASVIVAKQRSYVLAAARSLIEFDDRQLQEHVRALYPDQPFSDSGVRTRRSELVALGLVHDTGKRIVLPSRRRAIVWGVFVQQPHTETQP